MNAPGDARSLRTGFAVASGSAVAFALMSFLVHAGRVALPAAELALLRGLFGALLLLPWAWAELPRLFSWRARFVWLRCSAGSLSILCYFSNLQRTSVATARALADLAPLFVALLSWFVLREALRARELAGVALAVAGAALLCLAGSSAPPAGALGLGVLGAALTATSFLSLRKAAVEFSAVLVVWCLSAVSSLVSALALLVLAEPPWITATRADLLLVAGVGTAGIVGQILMTRAFAYLKASVASAFGLTVILWGLLLEYAFEGTAPDGRAWPAYALIALGAWLVQSTAWKVRSAGLVPDD